MPPSATEQGFYVDLEKTPDGNLAIRLNDNGQIHFATVEEHRDQFGIHAALYMLLEDHLAGEWEMIGPEEVGALTSAPILCNDVERDDDGDITRIGRVYWYPDYQVRDEIEELRDKLIVVFQGVD